MGEQAATVAMMLFGTGDDDAAASNGATAPKAKPKNKRAKARA